MFDKILSRKVSLRFLSQPQSMKKPALNVDLSPAAEEKSKIKVVVTKREVWIEIGAKSKKLTGRS